MDHIFVLPNQNEKTKQFTWNSKWVIPFESPWGVLEKFKYANQASTADIFKIFGVEKTQKKTYNWGKAERNIKTLEGLNELSLSNILGTDLKNNFFKNIDQILGALPNNYNPKYDNDIYIKTNLSYCSECICIGFHSIFHQLTLFDHCPYHNKLLLDQCQSCMAKIPYSLDDNWNSKPFVCKCGYSFLRPDDFSNFTKLWSKTEELKIQNEELNEWLNLNESDKIYMKTLSYPQEVAKQHLTSIITILLSIKNNTFTNNSFDHFAINSTRNIMEQKLSRSSSIIDRSKYSNNSQMYYDLLFKSTCATYKGITSHVKKKIHQHKGCLKHFTRKQYLKFPDNIQICPYSLAYANWRKHIEGYSYYWEIENGWEPKKDEINNIFSPSFASKQDYSLLKFAHSKCIEIFKGELFSKNIITMQWVVNRVLSFLAIAHLNHWISLAEMLIEKEIFNPTLTDFTEEIPFFIIKFPTNNKDSIQFHWWLKKEKSNETYEKKQMYCPIISNKKRYKYKLIKDENPYAYLLDSLSSKSAYFFEPVIERENKQKLLDEEIRKLEYNSRQKKYKLEKKEYNKRIIEEEAPNLLTDVQTEIRIEIARKLISLNIGFSKIVQATGLSEETICKLL